MHEAGTPAVHVGNRTRSVKPRQNATQLFRVFPIHAAPNPDGLSANTAANKEVHLADRPDAPGGGLRIVSKGKILYQDREYGSSGRDGFRFTTNCVVTMRSSARRISCFDLLSRRRLLVHIARMRDNANVTAELQRGCLDVNTMTSKNREYTMPRSASVGRAG